MDTRWKTRRETQRMAKAGEIAADARTLADIAQPDGHPSAARARKVPAGRLGAERWVLMYPWLNMELFSR